MRGGSHDEDNGEQEKKRFGERERKDAEVGDWSSEGVVMVTSDDDEVENDQK